VFVVAVINQQELAMAPPVTIVWWEGFSLFMVEAMMNVRANEIIVLAGRNLSCQHDLRSSVKGYQL
jgi:pyruvate dehydrogenase (quinone)